MDVPVSERSLERGLGGPWGSLGGPWRVPGSPWDVLGRIEGVLGVAVSATNRSVMYTMERIDMFMIPLQL